MNNIINNKVKDVIEIIKNMDLKNKLRLGVCMSSSAYINLKYNKSHIHSIFDKRLKELKFQWGIQDTADDYKFLIYEYDKYTKNIELNDIQADLYRDLCLARLEKRKIEEGRMEGDAGKVQSRILLLMNKLKLDNFTNKKELSLSQQSLIEDIAKVEKTEPADYFKDKKKYYDVNKIRQFLEKYVLRPTLNSLCDHRDFDIDMDDAKKYKSGLDVPYE